MPPAYGRQNSRILTVMGAGEIQGLATCCAATAPLPAAVPAASESAPGARLPSTSATIWRTDACSGSSISDVTSSPVISCKGDDFYRSACSLSLLLHLPSMHMCGTANIRVC